MRKIDQPLAEVFGFLTSDFSPQAARYRANRLCPFNNKVPNCTKDKAKDPLGVCSVFHGGEPAITCPIRFREDWLITDDAAGFFFPQGTNWSSLTEVRLNDANGRSEMPQLQQTTLFPEYATNAGTPKPVNVASVPQRSPFRYPGGKTWFIPTFREWVKSLPSRPRLLVEPFAGGGSISLTALFDDLVDAVVMVELDEDIAAVWQSIVQGDAPWLAQQILAFDLTRETVIAATANAPTSVRARAFQTILKNRTLHGGILAEGAGFLKTGENGKGIRSRWYPATLARRFGDLDTVRDRIDFRCANGLGVIQEYAAAPDVIFFIDPPYTAGGKKAGKRLYRYNELDHEQLFARCESIAGDFLLTYDNADEVRALARRHGFQMRLIPMNNTHHATVEELVIGKNLTWMDRFRAVHEPPADYLALTNVNQAVPADYAGGTAPEQSAPSA